MRQLGADTTYVLVGFPLAVIAFTLCAIGFALGVTLALLIIGVPILTATVLLGRAFATLERARIAPVLGAKPGTPAYQRAPDGSDPPRRFVAPLTDRQSWLDTAHTLVHFPLSTTAFSIVLVWWAGALAGLLYPLYDWALPHHESNDELPELLGLTNSAGVRMLFYFGIGLIFAITLPVVVRGCALTLAYVSRGMLSGIAELRQRIVGLEEKNAAVQSQRNAAVSAEAIALRRLERDIHDGPQQRLVRLAMDLGRAQQQLDTDPSAARATVAEAMAQARETLDELRSLSRGIAPPVLVDRGLAAALAALAGRSTVPVDLEAADVGRLPPAVESTAYFVVAESLTNVAKHSAARECRIHLRRTDTGIDVTVADDGVGGAHLAKGHGLVGLAERVHAAGGSLIVSSPAGAGTTVTAHLPL